MTINYNNMWYNKLSESELERLAILSEECSEVIKAVNKIIRDGYEKYNPNFQGDGNNREQLELELGDLEFIVMEMGKHRDIDLSNVNKAREEKSKEDKYLHSNSF